MLRSSNKENITANKGSSHHIKAVFPHGSPISMSHTMSFVYHLPPGYNQSTSSHPACLSILKNSLVSLWGTWREGCGGDGGKECVFSADRCPVQRPDRALNLDLLYGFRHCLHTSLIMFIAVWQDTSNHINKLTRIRPLHGSFFWFLVESVYVSYVRQMF